ncbi:hypothetical protein [Streptomyces sp. NPDC005435]|uniref:hypothetical protein n=1 Tax=Streptomyces sp. NPDC005435 TaxID=3154464 RepID=UPI00345299AE
MPPRHPEETGYGHVVERCVTRMYADLPRHLVLNGGRFLAPRRRHTARFTRPDGLWDQWVKALVHPGDQHRRPAPLDRPPLRFRQRVDEALMSAPLSEGAVTFPSMSASGPGTG